MRYHEKSETNGSPSMTCCTVPVLSFCFAFLQFDFLKILLACFNFVNREKKLTAATNLHILFLILLRAVYRALQEYHHDAMGSSDRHKH